MEAREFVKLRNGKINFGTQLNLSTAEHIDGTLKIKSNKWKQGSL